MKRKLAMFMAIILMIGCFTGAVAENAAPDMPALDAQPDSIWQKLADEGVISEETLSAIQQYLQENRLLRARKDSRQPPSKPGAELRG